MVPTVQRSALSLRDAATKDKVHMKPSTNRRKMQGAEKRLYAIWRNMRNRCLRPDHEKYHRYGARGITIHPAWTDFAVFRDDVFAEIGEPLAEQTFDRTDNNGNYRPGNIRWATQKVQQNNREHSLCRM
jgi:hypothetical protein